MPALEYRLTIHDLPTAERPRERLRTAGASALSTAELLAIILRVGSSGENVLQLAGRLLGRFGGLSGLAPAPFGQLCQEHGPGEAKGSPPQDPPPPPAPSSPPHARSPVSSRARWPSWSRSTCGSSY